MNRLHCVAAERPLALTWGYTPPPAQDTPAAVFVTELVSRAENILGFNLPHTKRQESLIKRKRGRLFDQVIIC